MSTTTNRRGSPPATSSTSSTATSTTATSLTTTSSTSSSAAEPARVIVIDLETLRSIVRDVMAETQPGSSAPDYYSQGCLPPGMTRRAFLDAIRRGDLPARAAGKARLVAREDYRAFIENAPPVRVRLRVQPAPANDIRALVRGSQGKRP